jgi:hypothetical protein
LDWTTFGPSVLYTRTFSPRPRRYDPHTCFLRSRHHSKAISPFHIRIAASAGIASCESAEIAAECLRIHREPRPRADRRDYEKLPPGRGKTMKIPPDFHCIGRIARRFSLHWRPSDGPTCPPFQRNRVRTERRSLHDRRASERRGRRRHRAARWRRIPLREAEPEAIRLRDALGVGVGDGSASFQPRYAAPTMTTPRRTAGRDRETPPRDRQCIVAKGRRNCRRRVPEIRIQVLDRVHPPTRSVERLARRRRAAEVARPADDETPEVVAVSFNKKPCPRQINFPKI